MEPLTRWKRLRRTKGHEKESTVVRFIGKLCVFAVLAVSLTWVGSGPVHAQVSQTSSLWREWSTLDHRWRKEKAALEEEEKRFQSHRDRRQTKRSKRK